MTGGRNYERRGVILGLGTLLFVLVADIATDFSLSGASFSVAAVLTAVTSTPRQTAAVAGLAIFLSSISGLWNHNSETLEWGVRLFFAVALGAIAVGVAVMRTRREDDLRRMTHVAETAQRAVLRALPTTVGSVAVAARYVSATREALIGGDLYEVVGTPYGVRVIVGDVRGKGVDAIQLAATVVGGFRRSALRERSLTTVVRELDTLVRAVAGDEDFVTVVLAEFHDDRTVTVVNCGHHAPLLVDADGHVDQLDPAESCPPLGLGPVPTPTTTPWPDGARMLLYTDGVVESRDAGGTFFPLTERATHLREGRLDDAIDQLSQDVVAHAGHELDDDMALVLAEHRPA